MNGTTGACIWCSVAVVLFAGCIAFLVSAGIYLKYGLTHYYTPSDLAAAETRALDFCNSTQCIANCTQFNQHMAELVLGSKEVVKYVCADTCLKNGCMDVFCPDHCFYFWTVFDHIRGETGENGQYAFDLGSGLLAAGIVCGVASVIIVMTVCG